MLPRLLAARRAPATAGLLVAAAAAALSAPVGHSTLSGASPAAPEVEDGGERLAANATLSRMSTYHFETAGKTAVSGTSSPNGGVKHVAAPAALPNTARAAGRGGSLVVLLVVSGLGALALRGASRRRRASGV